jgi:aminoglycoside phosphotransferase (APT) family kinase protein
MAGTPAAEVAIDAELVRRLLESQHPDLAAQDIVRVASGWDNAMCRLGRSLAVRLPRRAAAAELIAHEARWLPLIGPRLPLPVPVPVRTGVPGAGYPWSWLVVPWLEGRDADLAPPGPAAGTALAAFLGALHEPAPPEAPRNPYRGIPLAERAPVYEERLRRLAGRGFALPVALERLWQDALSAPVEERETWIHGDLHPRNILVDGDRLAAVLDWGDLARGDPATDLASVWLVLPHARSREDALRECRSGDKDRWRRARGWALVQALILLDAGLADDPRMAAIGHAVLSRLAEGP